MAIAYDSSVDGGTTTATSFTFAFNNVAGNIVFVGVVGDGTVDDVTGVTYNAVAMTLMPGGLPEFGTRNNYLYYLQNAPTGSHNVVVSAGSSHLLDCGAISYSGALTTGQPDATTHSNSGSAASTWTSTLASIADNCWHMLLEQSFHSASEAPGAGAGTTRRVYGATYAEWGFFDSNSAKTPAGSVSLTTTYSTAENGISHIMASFAPSLVPALKMVSPVLQAVNRASYF
jgi:hypothetical protein